MANKNKKYNDLSQELEDSINNNKLHKLRQLIRSSKETRRSLIESNFSKALANKKYKPAEIIADELNTVQDGLTITIIFKVLKDSCQGDEKAKGIRESLMKLIIQPEDISQPISVNDVEALVLYPPLKSYTKKVLQNNQNGLDAIRRFIGYAACQYNIPDIIEVFYNHYTVVSDQKLHIALMAEAGQYGAVNVVETMMKKINLTPGQVLVQLLNNNDPYKCGAVLIDEKFDIDYSSVGKEMYENVFNQENKIAYLNFLHNTLEVSLRFGNKAYKKAVSDDNEVVANWFNSVSNPNTLAALQV